MVSAHGVEANPIGKAISVNHLLSTLDKSPAEDLATLDQLRPMFTQPCQSGLDASDRLHETILGRADNLIHGSYHRP